jgi:hypothetical protein
MTRDEQLIQSELRDFNLDNMHHAARDKLVKVALRIGPLDDLGWSDFIDDGLLNLTKIGEEANVSRSSIYQNSHIKKYITNKAITLLENQLVSELPYKKKEAKPLKRRAEKYLATDKELADKNREIKKLQTEVSELSSQVDQLKAELKDKSIKLWQKEEQEKHLLRTGRVLR